MSSGSRRRVLSYEERVLWTAFTKAIAPLHASAHFDVGDVAIAPMPASAPLGRRLRQRVARGKDAIDARLDLHGLTQAQAHSTLLHFLRNAHARDARLVLVITGKGRGGETGVLRRQVPQWLGLPEFRSLVVGFEDAHIAHGGEGALYVRVRRTRLAPPI